MAKEIPGKKVNTIKPLSRRQFQSALEKGHGRALIHILEYGIGAFKDELLYACVHNLNYDTQIDESRAPWLFLFFKDADYYDEIKETLINTLESASGDDEMHIQHLLGQMALAGDLQARKILRASIFKSAMQPDYDWIIPEWIQLQTLDEYLDLARIFGKRLVKDQGHWLPRDAILPKYKKEYYRVLRKKQNKNHQ